MPMAGAALLREPHPLKRSQPSHSGGLPGCILCLFNSELKTSIRRIAQDRSVKACEPFRRNLQLELTCGFDLCLKTELTGDEVRRPRPQAVGDVIPGDDEIASPIVLATNHKMRVGMPCVKMISSDPVELGAEILFHLPHEIADEGLQV